MEQRRMSHDWRTRPSPLEAIWPRALEMLRDAQEMEAQAHFGHLAEGRGKEIKSGLVRTFQRRVRAWRLAEGTAKEVFFTQDHPPGKTLAVDWTDMGGVGLTIEGKVYAHKLFHAVLPYSNWKWATRVYSELALSLRGGLNATLDRLGRVPREILSDYSSTVTHQLRRCAAECGFNEEYLAICAHCSIEPRTINAAAARSMDRWR